MGDFNDEPESIEAVQEMMDEEAWTELGSNAHWWGKTRKEATCRSRTNAKESRIDGFIVNKDALPFIQDFYVGQDEGIPTHSCVGIKICRNTQTEEKRFARTHPCPKHFLKLSWKAS